MFCQPAGLREHDSKMRRRCEKTYAILYFLMIHFRLGMSGSSKMQSPRVPHALVLEKCQIEAGLSQVTTRLQIAMLELISF